ncbi:MAG: thiamine diphosphokinase [bacterium]
MKIFLIANGKVYHLSELRSYLKPHVIVAVNGGTNKALKNKVIPDIVIGDTDSLQKNLKTKLKIIKYPKDKDQSDIDLAISFILSNYSDFSLYCFGIIGNRVDHTLANIQSVTKVNERGLKTIIIESKETIFPLTEGQSINNITNNARVSILSLSDFSEVEIQGLKYSGNYQFPFLSSLGISNYVTSEKNKILCWKGKIIVIVYKKYRDLFLEN